MNHAALFNGIGGFQLAAEWMGWNNVLSCEIDEFCNKVTKYHYPNCIQHYDIKKTDFTIYRGRIDIITGGFPCQPFSQAGKRKGTADDRHLWPEMLRTIREIQPCWVVGENVHGIINWDGGLVFDQVQTDLETEGYEVWAYVLPACAVNAPHRRDRVWFVAHTVNGRYRNNKRQSKKKDGIQGENEQTLHTGMFDRTDTWTTPDTGLFGQEERQEQTAGIKQCNKETTPNPNSNIGHKRWMYEAGQKKTERHISTCDTWDYRNTWQNFPTQSPICERNDGISDRLVNITFPKWRNESIKALGNAIVPQVALQIFRAINEYY